LENVYVIWK